MLKEEESVRLCVFMHVCFVRQLPLAVLSDIWQDDFFGLWSGRARRALR